MVIPNTEELNADGVYAGAGEFSGSDNAHIPITGCDLLSEALPVSSKAVTNTESVRFPWPVNWK